MTDLSHWDFAEHFSGYDAAALILGVEPRESAGDQYRIGVVVERMRADYLTSIAEAESQSFTLLRQEKLSDNHLWPEDFFVSVELSKRWWDLLMLSDGSFEIWACDKRNTAFDRQSFDRNAIISWLGKIGQKSVYSFDRVVNKVEPVLRGRWPWGDHHTEALGHLEAAARRFWVAYDPAEPSTANINATVSEWLQSERKVSKTMADSIASMLRPDGLPPGPRR